MIEEILSVVDVSEDELLINRSNVFDSVANGEEQSKNSVRGRSRSRSNVSNTSVKSFRSIPSLRSNRSHHSRRSKSSSKSDNDSDNGSDSDSDSDNSNGGEHHVNNHIQYDDILRKANSTEEDYQNSLYHKIASAFGILKSVSFQLFLCFLWLAVGTVYYVYHDHLDWAKGFYMSVNVGWSINWPILFETEAMKNNDSKCFSAIFTSIGVIFVGVLVIYMANKLTESKEDWIEQAINNDNFEQVSKKKQFYESMIAWYSLYGLKAQILFLFVIFIVFGVVYYSVVVQQWDYSFAMIFMISTLSGGGFYAIPGDSSMLQYIVISLYTTTGAPLTSLALSIIVGFFLDNGDGYDIFLKVVADVTPDELQLMKDFGIDDGDGFIDNKEFAILNVVRIGAVPPSLITEIHHKFKQLDIFEKRKIPYAEITKHKNQRRRRSAMPIDTNAILQLQLMMGIRTNSVGPSNKDIEGGQTANLEMVPFESSNHNQNRSYRRSNSANAFVKTPLHQIDDSINDKELTTSENVFTTAQSNTATRKSINDSNKSLSPMSSSFSRASSEMKKDFSVGANSAVVYEFNQSIGSNDDGISTIDKHLETNAESKQINSIAADIETGLSIIRKVEDDSKSSSDFSDDDTVNEMNTTVITRSNNFKSRHYNSVPAVSISENSDAGQIESDLLAKEDNVGLPMPSNDNRTSFVKLGTPTNWSRIAPNGSFIASGPNRSVKSEKEKRMEQLRKAMEKYKSTHILKDENGSDTVKVKKSRLTKWLLLLDSPYVKLFIFWFVWITTGALVFFYSQDELNFVRSFYTSVSVGYNVFWVTLPRGSFSEKYGIVHMLVGNVAIGAAMAVSARVLVANKNNWYVDAMRAKLLEDAAKTDSFLDDVIAWCKYYWPKMKIHILFLIWLLFGIISSMLVVKPEHNWSFYDGLLFSASALTSGGLLPVPYDTADWYFGVIGLYIATGIPIMALSFGIIANTAVQNAGSEEFSQQISAPVTNEEIEMMRSFGMEDGDGAIDAMEYVILILVRIKALQPELINIINDRFNDLDKENAGKLSYEQILNNKVGAQRKSVGIVGSGTDKNDENISRSPIRRLTQSFSIKY